MRDGDAAEKDRHRTVMTRRQFAWLGEVAANRSLTRLDFHVAFAFSRWANFWTLTGWRPQRLLAQDVGASLTAVRNSQDRLEAAGHLAKVTEGNGRGHAATYRVIILAPETGNENVNSDPETGNGGNPFSSERNNDDGTFIPVEEQSALHFLNTKRPTADVDRCNDGLENGATGVAPNSLKKLSKHPLEDRASTNALDGGSKREKSTRQSEELEDGWRQFWSLCPRQEGEHAAYAEYRMAFNRGVPLTEINAGMRRYSEKRTAEIRTGDPPRFTKKPANWLREGGWKDRYAQATTYTVIDQYGNEVEVSQQRRPERKSLGEEQRAATQAMFGLRTSGS